MFEEYTDLINPRKLSTEKLKEGELRMGQALAEAAPNFKVDKKLCNRIIAFYQRMKSTEWNINWFGGCLLGTELIRFTPQDRDYWFDEVLEVDEDFLENVLERTGLNAEWNVSSDAFGVINAYILHVAYKTSPGFKDKLIYEAMKSMLSVWQFRYYSSLYSIRFKRNPVDMPAAEATYAALTMKFTIKQLGSWGAALDYRSERFLDKSSPHTKTYRDYKDINDVVYIVTDLSTRCNRTFYDYYNILDGVRKNNSRIGIYEEIATVEGEQILKDRSSIQSMSIEYLLSSSTSTSSFVTNQYLELVNEMVTTSSPAAVKDSLIALSNLPLGKERDEIEEVMRTTLIYTFNYVAENRLKFTQISSLLSKIRAVITASKNKEEDVVFMRSRTEKFITKHTHLKHHTTVASWRTAMLLYFIVKGLSASKQ